MLITCVLHIQPESHWEPRNEVGSLSPAEHLVGFELETFWFWSQCFNPLGHSPLCFIRKTKTISFWLWQHLILHCFCVVVRANFNWLGKKWSSLLIAINMSSKYTTLLDFITHRQILFNWLKISLVANIIPVYDILKTKISFICALET